MIPTDADVLAPGNLTIELGTYTWSHDLVPPFYYILLIDSAGNLVDTLIPEGHGDSRSITPQRLGRLGAGGRVVVVAGTAVPSGTYYVRVTDEGTDVGARPQDPRFRQDRRSAGTGIVHFPEEACTG